MSVVGLCDEFIERSNMLSNGGDPKFSDFMGHNFYSASALLAVQTAVLRRAILSVHLSFRHIPVFLQTNEDTIMWFSASGRTIILVSDEVKFFRIFAGNHR